MAELKVPIVSTTDRTGEERGAEKRRSRRVQIAMPVIVRGKSGEKSFEEKSATAAVNAHGCMLHLSAMVAREEKVTVIHCLTLDEQVCNVMFLGASDGVRVEVGLEFLNPCPQFWRMNFPPDNGDPANRKLFPSSPPALGQYDL